ncbi:TM2 domain-containing protein [Deinococcus yavapaiensis]|uniref:TM2 domain-containing membrane protein YozV n=1 Tax=Deinococcus yavapaiensis KR-236 TaxID=694435 RepID=A0A318SB70_9DEIO|nr:TM2 domain-containing protein [Deinococcus yavapaiensis]PYE53529.1 TM2 domain-containing membrane protein YozV [Deinococcus yavapaiensis KR-236]
MSMNDPQTGQPYSQPVPADTSSKKVLAGVLGILFGSLGVHKFVLGMNTQGFILLGISVACWILTIVTFGIGGLITMPILTVLGIIGLIEGIMYLVKSDSDFYRTYMVGKKPWF